MKCVRIEAYGGPEVMVLADIPVPAPGPGEVLVQVSHAGMNFMDIHTRQGKYRQSRTYPVRLPCTLGIEGAGRVVATGQEVAGFAPGDRVAWCIAWGSFAEYACVPARLLARVPDRLGLDMAAASMFHGCTAHYLAYDVARLAPGMSCLVHGASGGIGQILVQMARRLGVRVFATTSSAARAGRIRALGADQVLAYDGGRFADAVRDATGGHGVDVVFDAVGRETLRDSFRATRKRGLVVNFGSVSGSLDDLDPIELGEAGSLFLTRPRLADHMESQPVVQSRADAVFASLLDGSLDIVIAARHSFDTLAEGLERLEHRRSTGKPLLVVQPEAG